MQYSANLYTFLESMKLRNPLVKLKPHPRTLNAATVLTSLDLVQFQDATVPSLSNTSSFAAYMTTQ